jgi:hypothetical protein
MSCVSIAGNWTTMSFAAILRRYGMRADTKRRQFRWKSFAGPTFFGACFQRATAFDELVKEGLKFAASKSARGLPGFKG